MNICRLKIHDQGIPLTHLQRILWPKTGYTKGDLIHYYLRISPYLLPYVQHRPVTLVPYPEGITGPFFYQKRLPTHRPPWLSSLNQKKGKEEIAWPLIQTPADLIWLANRGCIEIHPWFSRQDRLDSPDVAVFDLDPSPGVSFPQVLQVARVIYQLLQEFSLQGFPKTSGQQGLHIYLPLKRTYTYAEIRKAVKTLSQMVKELIPQLVTLNWRKEKRHGVYLDYRQNGQGKTLVAPYSLRPTPWASVSTPLSWSLVEKGGFTPEDFRMETIWDYLEREGDPFYPLLQGAQSLPPEIL